MQESIGTKGLGSRKTVVPGSIADAMVVYSLGRKSQETTNEGPVAKPLQ